MTDSTTSNPPFGKQLYDEARRRGLMSLFTRRLSYTEIQQLKQADRKEFAKIFSSASYAMKQILKTESPKEIVQVLVREKEKSEMALLMMLFMIN